MSTGVKWYQVFLSNLTVTKQEYCKQYWTSPVGSTLQNSRCMTIYHPSRKLSKLDEQDMQDTAGEVVTYSCGPLHMDEQRQDDQLEPTYNSSVPIQDVDLKTCQKRWTIEKGGGRGSGRSVLMVRHDDDHHHEVTWSYHCSLRIIICYLKAYKFVQTNDYDLIEIITWNHTLDRNSKNHQMCRNHSY